MQATGQKNDVDNALFWDLFFSILARFGLPSCGHVGDVSGKIGGTLWDPPPFLCCVGFFSGFLGVRADFGPDFKFGAPFLIRFGLHFAATAGAMFRHSAANVLHSTGWWGYAAHEEFSKKISYVLNVV